jgi:ATP-binding cassette subfamily B protein
MRSDHQTPRRLIVPEVVQTSAMDCGPAVLTCLLEGFGIPAHYGRLREACQTDVDGTSVDTIEAVAVQLGLDAEQVMVPADHLLLPEARALPALLVVRLPSGLTHFVLAWRRHGPLVQVMDPAIGRRWMTAGQLLEEVYVHQFPIPAADWYDWACTDEFRRPLARRLAALGIGRDATTRIGAAAAGGWRTLAALDAATRFVATLVRSGGVRRGRAARGLLEALQTRAAATANGAQAAVPEAYWSAWPAQAGPDGVEQVSLRGAVLVRVRGRCPAAPVPAGEAVALGPELAAALAEPTSRPGQALLRFSRGLGGIHVAGLITLTALVAGGAVLEAVLLRAAIDLGRDLGLVAQRLEAIGVFLIFAGVVLLAEWRLAGDLARLGRRLEIRLRAAFLDKLPRLHDRYLSSRPTSDMAERSHSLHQVRLLPRLAGQFLQAALALVATAGAIAWADPPGAPAAIAAATLALALPIAFNPLLVGLDLRVRTHTGALSRFYLDALRGLVAVRAHGAAPMVRREHEGLLVDWARAGGRLLRWVVIVEGLQAAVGFGLAGWLILLHAGRAAEAGGMLLLAYWALSLPVLGEELAWLARQYPAHRNVTLRLLEPLGAPEEERPDDQASTDAVVSHPLAEDSGVALAFESVTVRAGGRVILEDVGLNIAAGEQVAIVGASGAGKSTLVGLLLGWHRAGAGRILVDGAPLDAARLDRLREETAWIDPAVWLWNRSLIENLLYGNASGDGAAVPEPGEALALTGLHEVLRRLPEGLRTVLGEGGGLLSGGEGQRVRLGRALLRARARLVILDEPFRGLDRDWRRRMLRRVRRRWQGATILCITHDVGETLDFDRVLVLERGRLAEDVTPARLAADPDSRYRALLDAERAIDAGLWSSAAWRRLRLERGRLVEQGRNGTAIGPREGDGHVRRNGDQLADRPAR